MLELPVFSLLREARVVLIAGAGGGYDFLSGLPLYLALRAEGKTVHLANMTFSRLMQGDGERITQTLVKIEPGGDVVPERYFPEQYLAQWLLERGEGAPVWCVQKAGGAQAIEAYEALVERLSPDTIVLIDGGTDSLMRGDEEGLGTPVEDMLSILAVQTVKAERKLLLSVGFGVDSFHGVCHAHVLEAVADLIRDGGYLGAFSLVREMSEARAFADALAFIQARMPGYPSVVASSIAAALEGRFGDHHATERTRDSTLFINPLMSLYFCFQLEAVARRVLYLEQLRDTTSFGEANNRISAFRRGLTNVRPHRPLPM